MSFSIIDISGGWYYIKIIELYRIWLKGHKATTKNRQKAKPVVTFIISFKVGLQKL